MQALIYSAPQFYDPLRNYVRRPAVPPACAGRSQLGLAEDGPTLLLDARRCLNDLEIGECYRYMVAALKSKEAQYNVSR